MAIGSDEKTPGPGGKDAAWNRNTGERGKPEKRVSCPRSINPPLVLMQATLVKCSRTQEKINSIKDRVSISGYQSLSRRDSEGREQMMAKQYLKRWC